MTDTQTLAVLMAILLSGGKRYEEAVKLAQDIARVAGLEVCQCLQKQ